MKIEGKKFLFAGIFIVFIFLSLAIFTEGKLIISKKNFEKNKILEGDSEIIAKFYSGSENIKAIVDFYDDSMINKKNLEISKLLEVDVNHVGKNIGKNKKTMIINSKEYNKLKNNELVKKITIAKEYHIDLQDSVPLINATVTWQKQFSGINLTGNGQTVCIIDTGINYSHMDLGGCYGNNSVSSSCKVIGGWDFCADNYNCSTEDWDPMDVEGHGTHVAGIAVANGSIHGVAPGAKVVMIKAGNGTGSFWDSEIILGMDWCINHATEFNISVISMSLGGNLFEGYCPGDNLEESVNLAVANGISVVAASGNDGYSNVISSPGCIQNATPVTSSPKSDNSISLFANTWNDSSLMIIDAPGENINSTCLNGKYCIKQGTSMATPHVAGAIAIINQYLKLIGKIKSPQEIENILNSTGKQIYDSYSNRSFSRIDIYSAVDSLEIPLIGYDSSSDSSGTTSRKTNIFVNITASDMGLKNLSIYLYNSSGLVNFSNTSTNNLATNFTNLLDGLYFFNATAYDIWSNSNTTLTRNITLKNSLYNIQVISPMNNTWYNSAQFNISLDSSGNCTFSLNNQINTSMNTSNSTYFFFINSSMPETNTNSSYNVSFYCNDSLGNSNSSKLIFFGVEKNPPVLISSDIIKSYSSATIYYVSNESVNAKINYATSLSLDQEVQNPNFSNSSSVTLSSLSSSTLYYYNITLCDSLGNCATNGTYNFTTDATPPSRSSSGGGGGGGGISPKTYSLNEQNLTLGASQKISTGDKITFVISGINHTIELKNIISDKATLLIRSEPINISLKISEETKLNLTSKNYFDLYIKLENISFGKANLTIKKIFETRPEFAQIDKGNEYHITNETNKTGSINNSPLNRSIKYQIEIIIILLIFAIIYYLVFRKHRMRKRKFK